MGRAYRLLPAVLGLVLALAAAGGAGAHDYWLELSSFRPKAGDRVTVSHRVGERLAGDPVPRNPLAILRFDATSPAGVASPIPGRDGIDPAGILSLASAGAWRIVY